MAAIDDVPEHVERVLLRPLIENFCYNYMYKQKSESFVVKTVEYLPKEAYGKADVYFLLNNGEYLHLVLKVPITKKHQDGKFKLHVQDPVVSHQDSKKPYTI